MRQSPVPTLEGISKEGFVLYKALSQTSSWESCDSNPFICSPYCLMKLLPNKLIYPCMPTYSTELEWDLGLRPRYLYTNTYITDTNVSTFALNLYAGIWIPTCAHTVHVCTYELKSLCGVELWEQLFLCISGLPLWITEKAALPTLNVSWCLPGCLFWEEIKGESLPLAPTRGGAGGTCGEKGGSRGRWMSFN